MYHSICYYILAVHLCTRLLLTQSLYSRGQRERFESKFVEKCSKYSFVQKYIHLLEKSNEGLDDVRYTIYVYNDGTSGNGGLGDRLGGLVTAAAFSIRDNRTLLIEGDQTFASSFQPYHPSNLVKNNRSQSSNGSYRNISWSNWSSFGWKNEWNSKEYMAANSTNLYHCVNPRPSRTVCALESSYATKVVKYRGNRSYICRWTTNPIVSQLQLLQQLGISNLNDVNLYEIAGCLLRLVMWPTEQLWKAIDSIIQPSYGHIYTATAPDSGNIHDDDKNQQPVLSTQISLHFRCGDISMSAHKNEANTQTIDSQCLFHNDREWKGTSFMDDYSLESPIDLSYCARKIINKIAKKDNDSSIFVYIASDNPSTANQMYSALDWFHSIKAPPACHIDLSSNNALCSLFTSAQWMLLSLSDHIVMQSLLPTTDLNYHDPISANHVLQPPPISAFSRYAAIYSLSDDVFYYGLTCSSINATALSRQTQGNWVCNPKTFF